MGKNGLTSYARSSYLFQRSLDSDANIKIVVAEQPLPIIALIGNGWLDGNVPLLHPRNLTRPVLRRPQCYLALSPVHWTYASGRSRVVVSQTHCMPRPELDIDLIPAHLNPGDSEDGARPVG